MSQTEKKATESEKASVGHGPSKGPITSQTIGGSSQSTPTNQIVIASTSGKILPTYYVNFSNYVACRITTTEYATKSSTIYT